MAMRFLASGILLAAACASLPVDFPTVPLRGVNGKVSMPLFGIGTWLYNDTVAEKAVLDAFAMGYRHVDTALGYQNQVGVGRALKEASSTWNLARDDYFVTTKIPGGLNASATAAQLDQCLEQLGLEYVDLMLIHFPAGWDGKGGREKRQEEWSALEAWAKTGKAHAIGVSHYCSHHAQDVLNIATVPIAVNQVQYHVGMGSAGDFATDYFKFFRAAGIVFESFSPLCGPCTPPDNKELIDGSLVTEIGKAHNKSGPQVALKWLVQQGIPVIPKTSKLSHMKENMELFDFELTADEMSRLTAAEHPPVGGGPSPTDSGDCGIEAQEDILVV